jgi:peroxiredoxin
MEQVVDLQNDSEFRSLGVSLLSISPDPAEAWAQEGEALGIRLPLLSDAGNKVATKYGVMRWKMPSNEPGHTFVLVGADGDIAWVRDYGAAEHGGLMWVDPKELVLEIDTRV